MFVRLLLLIWLFCLRWLIVLAAWCCYCCFDVNSVACFCVYESGLPTLIINLRFVWVWFIGLLVLFIVFLV